MTDYSYCFREAVLDKLREKRVRGLVRRFNRIRKRQAQKIDILCNDLVGSQRKFIGQLGEMQKTLEFYETIAGCADLEDMLENAASKIQDWFGNANVAVYFNGSFRTHLVDSQILAGFEYEDFEQCFTTETIEHICNSNQCLDLKELLMAGLQANPKLIKPVCAAVIPLTHNSCRGFLLVYKPADQTITAQQVKLVSSVAAVLAKTASVCMSIAESKTTV